MPESNPVSPTSALSAPESPVPPHPTVDVYAAEADGVARNVAG